MSATIIDLSGRREFGAIQNAEPERDAPTTGELRRARVRIAQLERNLTQAMRDSLANYNRAREAERRLAELVEG